MRSIFLTALLSTTALAFPGYSHTLGFTGNTRLDYCQPPDKPLIEVTKLVIKTGAQKVVTFTGKAKTDITDGAVSAVDLKLPIVGGPGQQFNFCKDLGVTCPVASGTTFTATHNLTVKLFPGFPEDLYKLQVLVARATTWPIDFLLCVDGPWKASSAAAVITQDGSTVEKPLVETDAHWEMK